MLLDPCRWKVSSMAVYMPAVGSRWIDTQATIRGKVPPPRLRLVVTPFSVDDAGLVSIRSRWYIRRLGRWVPWSVSQDVDGVVPCGEWASRMRLLSGSWPEVRRVG